MIHVIWPSKSSRPCIAFWCSMFYRTYRRACATNTCETWSLRFMCRSWTTNPSLLSRVPGQRPLLHESTICWTAFLIVCKESSHLRRVLGTDFPLWSRSESLRHVRPCHCMRAYVVGIFLLPQEARFICTLLPLPSPESDRSFPCDLQTYPR